MKRTVWNITLASLITFIVYIALYAIWGAILGEIENPTISLFLLALMTTAAFSSILIYTSKIRNSVGEDEVVSDYKDSSYISFVDDFKLIIKRESQMLVCIAMIVLICFSFNTFDAIIVVLYRCSLDSMFDVERTWSVEHRREFEAKILELHARKDWEGVYKAWIQEIELNSDNYGNYPDVMLHVLRKEMFDKEYIEKMISLADHAEQCCTNDNIRNEIYRIMLQICLQSDDPKTKSKGIYYYNKLPMLRHSREVYAKFIMKGEEYREQLQKNLIYLIDLAECSARQLVMSDMTPIEKLFYYQKAAILYETVLDGKFAGHYDLPLAADYYEIAKIYTQLGEMDKTAEYVDRIIEVLERHMSETEKENKSELLHAAILPNHTPFEQLCQKLLVQMLGDPKLETFKDKIKDMYERYSVYFSLTGE